MTGFSQEEQAKRLYSLGELEAELLEVTRLMVRQTEHPPNREEFSPMRMSIFCLLLFAFASAANATSNSGHQKGTVDFNGVKDRYDCIHMGGRWHPLTQRCTKTV